MRLRVVMVGLLLASVGAAAEQVHGVLEASHVRGAGDMGAEGTVIGVLRDAVEPVPDFLLQAEKLRVEVDIGDPTIVTGASWHNMDQSTETGTYTQASVEGTDVRSSYQWMLVPINDGSGATYSVDGTCLEAAASTQEVIERAPNADANRASVRANVADSARIHPCEAATLTVRGDFMVVLWEWDARLSSGSDEPQDLWSGRRQSSYDPLGSPDAGDVLQERREVFLHAWNAVLEMPIMEGDQVYGDGGSMHAEGSITAQNTRGTLMTGGGSVGLQDEALYIEGTLRVGLSQAESGLGLDVSGDIDGMKVNGSPVYLDRSGASGLRAGWLAWTVLLVVAAGAFAWQVLPRRAYGHALEGKARAWQTQPITPREERAMHWYSLGLKCHERGLGPVALFCATRAVRAAPHVADHRYLRAVIHKTRGRQHKQVQDLRQLVAMLPPGEERARVARMLARACQDLGRAEEARRWWATVRREAPMLFLASSREPGFKRLGIASGLPAWDSPDVA